ncbi:hypothetical protein MPSEU_000285000 [Mayamaea pseudoterrestris]|nr:hypothetical protein MPSEU_000285000 [Mayamaea pseudoterrestris]
MRLVLKNVRVFLPNPSKTTYILRRHVSSGNTIIGQQDELHTPKTIVRSSLCSTGRTIDFCRGWAWQQLLLSRRLAHRRRLPQVVNDGEGNDIAATADDNTILVLEHSPVYTLGRGANEKHLTFLNGENSHAQSMLEKLARTNRNTDSARLSVDRKLLHDDALWQGDCHEIVNYVSKIASPVVAPNGVPIYRVERGGEVTFHGPGQLVVYPMLDLQQAPFRQDLKWYLCMLEEVVINVLEEYDIVGVRDCINTGVWVDQRKICAVGVSASRWITTHGFALNVSADLDYFDASFITPCGIEGRGVTSLAEILQRRGAEVPTLSEVSNVVLDKIQQAFRIDLEHGDNII